jgi:hypothetical protein
MSNLPRLAAHAWTALGDAERAMAAAEGVRWVVARAWTLERVARRLPVARPAVDARIVALFTATPSVPRAVSRAAASRQDRAPSESAPPAATLPFDRGLLPLAVPALLRLGRTQDAERALRDLAAVGDAMPWEAYGARPWRALAAHHGQGGDVNRVARVGEEAGDATRRHFERLSPQTPPDEVRRHAIEAIARVQLAGYLAGLSATTPYAQDQAHRLLQQYAPPHAVEGCVAADRHGCFPFELLVQAIEDIPPDP